MNKITTFLLGIIALAISFALYVLHGSIGFPDSHLTELDSALVIMYRIYIILALIFGVVFIYASFKKLKDSSYSLLKKYFAIGIALAIMIYVFLILTLDSGQGG